jgi:hypothetical protein
MKALNTWTNYFDSLSIGWEPIKSNPNAISLTGIAGAPLFRTVETAAELNDLHSKARKKSAEVERLLAVALPLDHPLSSISLPGEILLPKCRVYAGHSGSTFSLTGHLVQSEFLTTLKKEVTAIISNGTKVKTPLLDWLLKLAGDSWVYGKPSSLSQLDSLIALVVRDPTRVGHVRTRQFSFGRGCGDAMLLPVPGVVLKNNRLNQSINKSDFRFIGLEAEMRQTDSARQRIHAQFSNSFLTVLSDISPNVAEQLNSGADIGASRIGAVATKVLSRNVESVSSKAVDIEKAMVSL